MTVLIADKLIPRGQGLSPVLLRRAASAELDWDTRQRSRFELHDSLGRRVAAVLPRGSIVRGGDVLVVEDGSLVRVIAAAQPVMIVRSSGGPGGAFDLMRAAYHLGNRHVALALEPDRLLIEPDHVLALMLQQMHLRVESAEAPFEPEAGAYAHAGAVPHQHASGIAHVH